MIFQIKFGENIIKNKGYIMEVSNKKFAKLIEKAITINDLITKTIMDDLKIDISVLEKWTKQEEIPLEKTIILQKIIKIMLGVLGNLTEEIK